MKHTIKLLAVVATFWALATAPLYSQALIDTAKANHFTTKTTWTPVAQTVRLYSIVINTSNAGSTWTLTVANKEDTAKLVISALTLATTQNPLVYNFGPQGIVMTGGIDVISGGTTAGVGDVFVTYR